MPWMFSDLNSLEDQVQASSLQILGLILRSDSIAQISGLRAFLDVIAIFRRS